KLGKRRRQNDCVPLATMAAAKRVSSCPLDCLSGAAVPVAIQPDKAIRESRNDLTASFQLNCTRAEGLRKLLLYSKVSISDLWDSFGSPVLDSCQKQSV